MPTQGQYFEVNVEKLYSKIENDVCEITSNINELYDKISTIIY